VDLSTYKIIQKYKGNKNKHYFIRAAYDNIKELIMCGSEEGRVFFWKRESANEMYSFLKILEFNFFLFLYDIFMIY
jgi:hypothetical protein